MLRASPRDRPPRADVTRSSGGLLAGGSVIVAIGVLALIRLAVDVPSLDLLFVVPVLAAAWHHDRKVAGYAALVAAVASHAVWLLTTAHPTLPASALDLGVRLGVLGALVLATTTRRDMTAEQTRVANHDPQTGALSRRGFYDRLRRRDARLPDSLSGTVVTALFADLDGLKAVNDRYGHEEGDRVIRALADACRTAIGPDESNLVARFGGDEFVVVLPGADAAQGAAAADRILRAFAQMTSIEAGSVSIGVASTSSLDDMDALLRAADQAMYDAKRSGGSRYRAAGSPADDEHLLSRSTIEHRHPQPAVLVWPSRPAAAAVIDLRADAATADR